MEVLVARGRYLALSEKYSRLPIGTTVLLQSLAKLKFGKGVGKDLVPSESLKNLDWHSFILILEMFQNRLDAVEGYDGQVQEWRSLLAQFIPKAKLELSRDDAWRAVLVSSSLQKWYLTCLLSVAAPWLEQLPPYIMGFRKGFQTAMLLEPLRIALLLAREWSMPIALG